MTSLWSQFVAIKVRGFPFSVCKLNVEIEKRFCDHNQEREFIQIA